MGKIKTRDVLKGTIKAIDKSANAAERMKNAVVSTKEKAESSVSHGESSPNEYAQNRMTESGEKLAKEGAYQFNQRGKQGVVETKENIAKAKHYFENRQLAKRTASAGGNTSGAGTTPDSPIKPSYRTPYSPRGASPQDGAKKLAEKNIRHTAEGVKNRGVQSARQSAKLADDSVRLAGRAGKTIKTTGKGTIKTAGRSVKTAQQTAKTTVKTLEQAERVVRYSAKATAKAAQASARAAKVTAKATVATIKAAAKTMVAVIKALIAATKALVAAIAASGWIVVVVLLVICLVGFLVASPFGIFFSGDAASGTSPIRDVVAQTSNGFSSQVIDIVNNNPHDEMRMTVTNRGYLRAENWIDVLTIYAISTATQDSGGADVVTLDDSKAAKIREIFWEMVEIRHHMETESREEPVLDEDGNDTGETTTVTTEILILEILFKGAMETADAKGFTSQQKEIVSEMLSGNYDDMFRELIGNIGLISMTGDGSGAVGSGDFIWPVPSSDYVTSPFGSRVDPITGEFSTHLGIDISGGLGTPIVATDAGTVVSTSVDGSYGIHALIDHGNGSFTLYAHMSSISVGVGDSVDQCQQIGGMGETGRARGVHLHFEVWQGGSRVDPLPYFSNYTTAW